MGNGASLVYPQEILDAVRALYPGGIKDYPPRAEKVSISMTIVSRIYTYTCMYVCMAVCMCVSLFVCLYVYLYVCLIVSVCVPVCLSHCMYVWYVCIVCIVYTYIHTYIHTYVRIINNYYINIVAIYCLSKGKRDRTFR